MNEREKKAITGILLRSNLSCVFEMIIKPGGNTMQYIWIRLNEQVKSAYHLGIVFGVSHGLLPIMRTPKLCVRYWHDRSGRSSTRRSSWSTTISVLEMNIQILILVLVYIYSIDIICCCCWCCCGWWWSMVILLHRYFNRWPRWPQLAMEDCGRTLGDPPKCSSTSDDSPRSSA